MKKIVFVLGALALLLQYRLWFGDGNLLALYRMQGHIETLRAEVEKRQQRNAALEAEVRDLKQGSDAIEEQARYDLGMIRRGETFVQVINGTPNSGSRPTEKKANPP